MHSTSNCLRQIGGFLRNTPYETHSTWKILRSTKRTLRDTVYVKYVAPDECTLRNALYVEKFALYETHST